jgi:hypothetical protein
VKWKVAVAVFIITFIAALVVSHLAFSDLKNASDRKIGSASGIGGWFYGLANMELAKGDSVNYEYHSDTEILFVVRLYSESPPYQYEGTELVNTTGASGTGVFSVPATGFYVFQALALEQGSDATVTFDFYIDVPIGLDRSYAEAGIAVALFGASVSILVAGMRWAAGGPQKGSPSLVFWRTFVTNWQSWSPGIGGGIVALASMLIRFSSPELWYNDALELANQLGGTAAFWGLLFGLTYTPPGKKKEKADS